MNRVATWKQLFYSLLSFSALKIQWSLFIPFSKMRTPL